MGCACCWAMMNPRGDAGGPLRITKFTRKPRDSQGTASIRTKGLRKCGLPKSPEIKPLATYGAPPSEPFLQMAPLDGVRLAD